MPRVKSDLERWMPEAIAIASDEAPATNVPLHVLLGEAVDVAAFFERRYEDQTIGGKRVPGLRSVVNGKSAISAKTGADVLSLQRAAQAAQTQYLLVAEPKNGADAMERGRFLLDEITAALEFLFDDGVEDENDARLASVDAAHANDPDTADALAGALDDFAALAEPHRAALDGLGGFDAAAIDEAREVAASLRARPASPAVQSDASRHAIAIRNKVLRLLFDRMNTVRKAARFVFRQHPEIAREVTSAYERRRRAASRRAKVEKPAAQPPA